MKHMKKLLSLLLVLCLVLSLSCTAFAAEAEKHPGGGHSAQIPAVIPVRQKEAHGSTRSA